MSAPGVFCVVGLLALLVSGCNTINPIVAADNAMVIKDTQAANDNLVVSISASICEVPIGAVIRNPAFVPIATAACMPGGQAASAATMMQNMGGNPGVPAYQQVIDAHQPVQAPAQSVAPVSANLPTPAPVHQVRSRPYIAPTVKQPLTAAPVPIAKPITQPAIIPPPAFGTLPGGALP